MQFNIYTYKVLGWFSGNLPIFSELPIFFTNFFNFFRFFQKNKFFRSTLRGCFCFYLSVLTYWYYYFPNWHYYWKIFTRDIKTEILLKTLTGIYVHYCCTMITHFSSTHFIRLVSFCNPWKHQKTRVFLFLGGINEDWWHEMIWERKLDITHDRSSYWDGFWWILKITV